jgi:hypothetical protein
MQWGLGFMGLVKLAIRYTRIQYIIVTTNYITKWVKAKALHDNIAKRATKFIYEQIVTRFGCPTHLVSD